EAHGSGTALGDPIEIASLAQALDGAAPGTIAIGSIKANLGHADAASGLCGLAKLILCLRKRTLVPTPGFVAASPHIDFARTPLYVQTRTEPWESKRVAGVSSFGMGGTNAHAIVEESPSRAGTEAARPWHLVPLSARTRAALEMATSALAEHLQA